ncbi:PMT family membrane protein [Campylobacter corcagiensis]|nr:PMT family membrane protein [Campylobacter corcagiensis]
MLRDENFLFVLIFLINLVCLLFAISNLSISHYEAQIFFNSENLVSFLANLSCHLFGQNDFAVRLPFLLIHLINCIIMYRYSKLILKRKGDRLLCVSIYMFLPGTMVSAIVVNEAGIILFFTLLFLYLYESKRSFISYMVLTIALFVDSAFGILYLGVLFYAIYDKKRNLAIVAIVLLMISIIFYNYDIHGKPRGYFLDAVGIYAAVFSLFGFLFFIYAVYRIWIKERKSLLWFIVITAFLLSLILSFRQRFDIEKFLPFATIAVPLIVKVFFSSQRIRLPKFRKKHNFFGLLTLIFLAIHSFFIINSQILYPIVFKNEPSRHFIYKFDIAKDLANELKSKDINSVITLDSELRVRLKFYGIQSGGRYILSSENIGISKHEIDIVKFGNTVVKFYLL